MNCFGKFTESTESLIRHEEEDEEEVVNLCREHERLEIVEIEDEDQTGEDEVGEEMEEEKLKLLTDEELQTIAEEVDKREEESAKKERPDFLTKLLEHCINTILLEELNEVGQRMNAFRKVLADGVMKFAQKEEAENNRVKMDRFVDSFRAAWKEWKKYEDGESVLNVFMHEMEFELWHPER